MHFPILTFLFSFLGLCLSAALGVSLGMKRGVNQEQREDLAGVQAATLTLLGLIIGFSFSMASSRYDLRKHYEEQEANAIDTAMLRADLLPSDAADIKALLVRYLDQRVAFYQIEDPQSLQQVNAATATLQNEMWSLVQKQARMDPSPVTALAVSGVNDVLTAEGYAAAAWRNRIPAAAWMLMEAIAFFGTLLVGFGAHRSSVFIKFALPLVISVALFLIADLDSPWGGLIHTQPQNLRTLAESLKHVDGGR